MTGCNTYVFFGDHAVSAAPFGDNLPGLACAPSDAAATDATAPPLPDAPLLTGPETLWISAATVLAAAALWVAGA